MSREILIPVCEGRWAFVTRYFRMASFAVRLRNSFPKCSFSVIKTISVAKGYRSRKIDLVVVPNRPIIQSSSKIQNLHFGHSDALACHHPSVLRSTGTQQVRFKKSRSNLQGKRKKVDQVSYWYNCLIRFDKGSHRY